MLVIESAGITDVGKKRKGNEDSFFIDDDLGLFVVADGMGGHLAGEVASRLAVETIHDYMQRFKNGGEVEELDDGYKAFSKESNRILSSISLANQGIYGVSRNKEAYRGMGCTLSAVYSADNSIIAANVGDSPIYLVHEGSIELISVLHTVRAEQRLLDPEGAEKLGKQFDHMLTRALGTEEEVEADSCEIQVFKNDILVISSDGLTDKVSQEEIFDVVVRERPDKACRTLVNMANERGGDDNITVIVLKVRKIVNKKGGFLVAVAQIIEGLYSLPLIFLRKSLKVFQGKSKKDKTASYPWLDSALSIFGRLGFMADALRVISGFVLKGLGLVALLCFLVVSFLLVTMENEKNLLKEVDKSRALVRSSQSAMSRSSEELQHVKTKIIALEKKDLSRADKIVLVELNLSALQIVEELDNINLELKHRKKALEENSKRVEKIREKSFIKRLFRL